MSAPSRDLASRELWEASLERSRARRHRAPAPVTFAPPAPARHHQGSATPAFPGTSRAARRGRDLSDPEHWELSTGRSRTRRRAAEIQFVPGSTRAKRLSVGTLAALTAGPAVAAGEAGASDSTSSADVPTTTEHTVVIVPGSSGRHVRALQRALDVRPDGVFGVRTQAAVHHFQTRHGLRRDGVVGARTAAALRGTKAVGSAAPAASAPLSSAHAVRATIADHGRDGRARSAGEMGAALYDGPSPRGASHVVSSSGSAAGHELGAPGSTASGTPTDHHLERPRPSVSASAPAVSGAAPSDPTPSGAGPSSGRPGSSDQSSHATHGPPTTVRVSETGGSAVPDSAPPHQGATTTTPGTSGSSTGVAAVVTAGNRIARLPYRYGGGHASFNDKAYDCSGSVSYALHGAGLISSPQDSTQLESYGAPGPGKRITVYANAGHAFMTVDGRRFDTVALHQTGSRWSSSPAPTTGYLARHPKGY
jgi:peptidoglycan hydrolase-like protein with peptidoglycan-binding domain